jgi:hypothetical protein
VPGVVTTVRHSCAALRRWPRRCPAFPAPPCMSATGCALTATQHSAIRQCFWHSAPHIVWQPLADDQPVRRGQDPSLRRVAHAAGPLAGRHYCPQTQHCRQPRFLGECREAAEAVSGRIFSMWPRQPRGYPPEFSRDAPRCVSHDSRTISREVSGTGSRPPRSSLVRVPGTNRGCPASAVISMPSRRAPCTAQTECEEEKKCLSHPAFWFSLQSLP